MLPFLSIQPFCLPFFLIFVMNFHFRINLRQLWLFFTSATRLNKFNIKCKTFIMQEMYSEISFQFGIGRLNFVDQNAILISFTIVLIKYHSFVYLFCQIKYIFGIQLNIEDDFSFILFIFNIKIGVGRHLFPFGLNI